MRKTTKEQITSKQQQIRKKRTKQEMIKRTNVSRKELKIKKNEKIRLF